MPAYITWERYLANQQSLHRHRSGPDSKGSPRDGSALLAGLVVCGNCGRCLQTSNRTHAKAYYSCVRHLHEGTEQACFGLKAAAVDELVERQVLRSLEPAALELSCQAMEDIQRDRARLDKHWRQRLERARYEAEDAERRYRAVDPENRLVARSLERRWEETLQAERQVRDDYDRFLREQPPQLSREERARIAALSSDLSTLWHAPGTTYQDRKEIIRHLVEKVVVHVKNDSEHVDVTIQWQGGFVHRHEVVRPVATYAQLRDGDRLMERVVELRRAGGTAATIAEALNAEGFSPPKCRGPFTKPIVWQLLVRRGLVGNERTHGEPLGPHEWWLVDLACKLQINSLKLRDWICRGWVTARQTPVQGYWVAWADEEELGRLRELAARSHRGRTGYSPELTTPRRSMLHARRQGIGRTRMKLSLDNSIMTYNHPPIAVPATPGYVLDVIRDSHRQQCQFDPEAEPDAELTFNTTVAEWRSACDLLDWRRLGRALDGEWDLGRSDAAWRSVLGPAKERTLREVCEFIAPGAVRPSI